MKVLNFPEVNVRIAENQPEYETLPVKVDISNDSMPATMCLELDEEEIKQVKKTGRVWITVLTFGHNFHPIKMSFLKPADCTEPPALRKYFIYKSNAGDFSYYKTKKAGTSRGKVVGFFFGALCTDLNTTPSTCVKEGATVLLGAEMIRVATVKWFVDK